MSDNIKVVVKVRPLISREIEDKLSYQWRVKNDTLYQLDQNGKDFGSCFTFDKVYDKDTKTCDIYNDIAKPIVEAATAGFNGTIFAYGQTSSGKTYTMTGTEDSPGIIPLAIYNLFQIIKKIPDRDFLVRVSYIEIYNETLKDLLDKKKIVKIQESYHGIKVDCTEQVTTSPEEVLKFLKEGEANRQTGATNMNEESSRSHSIFQITIESREHIDGEEAAGCVNVSQLNLVDLAGSERAGQTGATGKRFIEGTHINKSLSSLALVIKQLSEDQTKHVNYRDSKLTRILQNSLGGNAKTSIICAITPAAVEETISTLQFANRAKAIKNKPEVNAVATDATMIQQLTKQLSKLQSQLESKKNLEVMLESKKHVEHSLQKQIAGLQRLILNGFETRSSRRKLVPPRRVTISTLHPIDEDPLPSIPKFHTPLLKYNPILIPSSTDFVPIQNSSKLSSLSEETENRLITPPPQDRKVNFNDEIIELDSDDDDKVLDVQTCSPYHKCYGSSKTPPCVLRKNAKLAEKNLKDIVELTEREKIYTPSVIELIEKLEQNTTVIAKLEDEVTALTKRSKEKDLELEQLKVKVSKSNEEIKLINSSKEKLEALCNEYTTKLTDWEVSYDTLKTKTKRREDELLSLLDEHKMHKQVEDIGKLPEKPLEKELNFMDMSKDISLVNSDNESSIITYLNDGENASLAQYVVTDMQSKFESRNQCVTNLEQDLLSQKQKILSLENSSKDLQKIINDFKEKVDLLENENSLLKSTVESLNSTIQCQKSNLDSATSDIESYNNLIQELQIKLTNKEKITNLIFNEDTLEKMIATEEKFIANNENMRNIIHSFKMALESRDQEIESLKSGAESNSNNINNQEEIIVKQKEIDILNENVKQLQDRINDNVDLIDKLVQEKTNLKDIEQKLASELLTITTKFNELEKTSFEKDLHINTLQTNVEQLVQSLNDKTNVEKELSTKQEVVAQNEEKLKTLILDLQEEIKAKNNLIYSLNTKDDQNQACIDKANSLSQDLQSLISKFNGNIQDVPPSLDNLNDIFTSISTKLHILEQLLTDIITQKDLQIEKYSERHNNFELCNKNLQAEASDLNLKIEECKRSLQEHESSKNELETLIIELRSEVEHKINAINDLQANLTDLREKNETLSADILSRDKTLLLHRENEKLFQCEIESLKEDIENNSDYYRQQTIDFEGKEKMLENTLHEKETYICSLTSTITELKENLQVKSDELKNVRQQFEISFGNEKLLEGILDHATKLLGYLNINIKPNCYDNTFDKIMSVLNDIETHIVARNSENSRKMDEMLLKAQETIESLGYENHQLLNNISELDSSNKSLLCKIEEIQSENKTLNDKLRQGNETLEVVKTELNQKRTEIEDMVVKTQNLKGHFDNLDVIMKEQMQDIRADNDKLKARCSELEINLNDRLTADVQSDDIETRNNVTTENNSPPSLLTICCNTIFDAIQPCEKSASPSDSNTTIDQSKLCDCDRLLAELSMAENEKHNLLKVIDHLKSLNINLVLEQEQVRQEVQLLLEPAYELQKRINNHKTNLSTLTATTYAENKSLRSQVTVLQHHHSRFHKVCQRDLPIVKRQLNDLMTILKGDSFSEKHDASFKRYSLPSVLSDGNSTLNNLKNESTLDGDLLMLDTNLTLTTSADNTLMGLDQTCLEMTQVYSHNDVGCQTYEVVTHDINQCQVENIFHYNQEILDRIEALEIENKNLKQHKIVSSEIIRKSSADAQISPIKINCTNEDANVCEECEDMKQKLHSLEESLKLVSQKLTTIEHEKADIQNKYDNLTLEIPSTDALLKRISIFEKELNGRVHEITKLTSMLNSKNQELKQLQEENDTLSTQVMENITETDNLNKELDIIKEANVKLQEKCCDLEKLLIEAKSTEILNVCQCRTNSNVNSLQNVELHSKLNRSLSDSDTSSRYNKICTLQNELHAGREDCKELSEEVTVIKNHLDRSNLSMSQNMDLDDSMGESNIFSFTKHFDSVGSSLTKFSAPNSTQERHSDVYAHEKIDCINYYVEKTGADKENFDCNVKIIDVLKMFYTNFVMKHNNEVENLVNKIKCFEESKHQLEIRVNELSMENTNVTKKLSETEHNYQGLADTITQIKQNTTLMTEELSNTNVDNTQVLTLYKEKFLKVIDTGFGISSVPIFEKLFDHLVSKHQNDLITIMNEYKKLQSCMERVASELSTVNEELTQMRCQLMEKEKQYDLLKEQKERIHEISNAVTLDIIKKEHELCQTIMNGCKKLVEGNLISATDIDMNLPMTLNINMLFDRLSSELKNLVPEKESLALEVKKSKSELEKNYKALESLKLENDQLKEMNHTMTQDLLEKDSKLQIKTSEHDNLNNKYEKLAEENKSVVALVEKSRAEIEALKDNLQKKEIALQEIESNRNSNESIEKEAILAETMKAIETYKQEIHSIKRINDVITKEKEAAVFELEESREILKKNSTELDKMTADILVLREAVKENVSMIETLKLEAKSLLQQNILLKEQLDGKGRDCSRLEMNIKTHEKTVEIQSKMIIRLQKQKEDDEKVISDQSKRLEDLTKQMTILQNDSDSLRSNIKATKEELDEVKKAKETLEVRLSEVEADLERTRKPRMSSEGTAESARRRRQSLHDSMRAFTESQDYADHNKVEAVFDSRPKPADLFMDVDDDAAHSNRSTPLRTSRGRDSLLSRHDQSDEPVSRPSSVAEARRRRQSIHDLHRVGISCTPEPHERPSSKLSESTNRKSTEAENDSMQSEVQQLRTALSTCQQELEELREQYRELDDECETCAQQLRERDEQCSRLKREKTALQNLISELKEKLQTVNPNRSQQEPKVALCHAAVNTDEDWANLHSVVVDRMSFDAEVEKNKRLTKTIEELRFKKLELKMTLTKMQKALEKNAVRDHSKELEATKSELVSCKRELQELQDKYKELDEECETCSTYLEERNEQCRKLKREKAALEAKLQELSDTSAARRRRRGAHDLRRAHGTRDPPDPPAPATDAATQISDDFLNNQVERDGNSRKNDDEKSMELGRLKMAVEKLSQQKAALEYQLASAPAPNPMYIATGSAIVQNQQLTDVMKENQKLKKINTKLVDICKKRGKRPDSIIQDISEQGSRQ